jgi:DNA-methyltransferase (dcm)
LRPIAIDLFAGAGGMSLGLEQAGFDVACAVEYDPVHAAVHAFNFPACTTLARSVTDLTGKDIRALSGIGGAPVHLVAGGPPCQGFSVMGKAVLDDPRNMLLGEPVRLAAELDAAYFVLENVKGLTFAKNRPLLEAVVARASDLGYGMVPHRVLDAASYGVPQCRHRLILLGYRLDMPAPAYPVPEASRVTCAEAIGDLPDIDLFPELEDGDSVRFDPPAERSAYAERMAGGDFHAGHRHPLSPDTLTSSARTRHADEIRDRFAAAPHGRKEPVSRFFKLDPDDVCSTLRAGTDAKRGSFTSPRPIHYLHPRCLSVREMARLHGFPDWFRFHVTKWHGAREVGNAVPPPLARAVGGAVMTASGIVPETPSATMSLGDPALLAMDVVSAGLHFGVPNPIGTRDRRSRQITGAEAVAAAWSGPETRQHARP